MSWHYRAPTLFPAYFKQGLISATLEPGERQILAYSKSISELKAVAEQFRWFRWCIRQKAADKELFDILETFDIRSRIEHDEVSYILYIVCNPTKISELIRLNPQLALDVI
jgi:hypothetical protein